MGLVTCVIVNYQVSASSIWFDKSGFRNLRGKAKNSKRRGLTPFTPFDPAMFDTRPSRGKHFKKSYLKAQLLCLASQLVWKIKWKKISQSN